MKLLIRPEARKDLQDIRAHTRKNFGRAQADRYEQAFATAFRTLLRYPEIGYSVDDIHLGYRCYQIQSHSIFYRLDNDELIIVAVLHQNQLPTRHIDQRSEE